MITFFKPDASFWSSVAAWSFSFGWNMMNILLSTEISLSMCNGEEMNTPFFAYFILLSLFTCFLLFCPCFVFIEKFFEIVEILTFLWILHMSLFKHQAWQQFPMKLKRHVKTTLRLLFSSHIVL